MMNRTPFDAVERSRPSMLGQVEHYAGAVAMVAVCTLIGMWIAPRWGTAPVDMIYLPAVLAAAALWGFGPAMVAGLAAALAYNFFFTAPVHTFRMDRDRCSDGRNPAHRRACHQPAR